MTELQTSRLSIRPFRLDDAPFILRLLNEPGFIENIGDRGVRTLEDARRYLSKGPLASYVAHGFGLWHVALAADESPIGMAGLLKRDYLEDIDIGYALLPEYCGAGYAYEATRAVMAWAREQLHASRVVAIVSQGNEPSVRLLRKLGFEDAGVVRPPGEEADLLLFAAAL